MLTQKQLQDLSSADVVVFLVCLYGLFPKGTEKYKRTFEEIQGYIQYVEGICADLRRVLHAHPSQRVVVILTGGKTREDFPDVSESGSALWYFLARLTELLSENERKRYEVFCEEVSATSSQNIHAGIRLAANIPLASSRYDSATVQFVVCCDTVRVHPIQFVAQKVFQMLNVSEKFTVVGYDRQDIHLWSKPLLQWLKLWYMRIFPSWLKDDLGPMISRSLTDLPSMD